MSAHRHQMVLPFLVSVFAAFGCHNGEDSDQFQAIPHPSTGNAVGHIQYVVYVPREIFQTELLPVVLFLNGWGQNGSDGLRQVSNNFGQDVWRRRNQLPFLAVCPQCSKDEDFWRQGGPDMKAAMACLDDAIERFDGDPDRVYVTGTSSGAHGVMAIAAEYPNRFAGLVPVASGTAGDITSLSSERMPLWCIVNQRDGKHHLDAMRDARHKWLEAGLSPIVIEADRRSGNFHNAWDEAYGPTVAYEWMLRQSLGGNKHQEFFTLLASKDVLESWAQLDSANWAVNEADEILGSVTEKRGLLVSPPISGTGEWHLDIFLQGGQRARLGICAHGQEHRVTEIILELPQYGSGGIRSPDGQWLSILDPMGQQALYGDWNDVRLSRANGVIQLTINGWPAAEFGDPTSGQPLRWALIASPDEPIRARYLRQRSTTSNDARVEAS